MRIIILGAGRVGESVAETLVSEANDITVVDPDPERLRALEERLDLRGVAGNLGLEQLAASLAALEQCCATHTSASAQLPAEITGALLTQWPAALAAIARLSPPESAAAESEPRVRSH